MSIELTTPELTELKPKITVIGVGGAGGNAVNNMINAELQGVEFVAANTDAQALSHSRANRKIQLGATITQGLGAGSQPDVGRAAAEETLETIEDALSGCHMAFITAGMGGGTGTGAAPVIARHARERGILTIGVVTKPFQFEGARRMSLADSGIEELQKYVDTLIIIPNQNLFRIANEKTTFADAFGIADEVLHSGVRGITDLMVMPGLINLDFADVRTVMAGMGKAMMGTGEAEGENRAIAAAEAAISNPLLDETSMKGAKGVIINITGGMDLTLFEVDEAANHIRNEVDPDANIIVGSAFNEELNGKMQVSVVATGVGAEDGVRPMPMPKPKRSEPEKGEDSEKLGLALVFPGQEKGEEVPSEPIDVDEPPHENMEEAEADLVEEEAEAPVDESEALDGEVHEEPVLAEAETSSFDDEDILQEDEEEASGTKNEVAPDDLASQIEAEAEDSFIPDEAEVPDSEEPQKEEKKPDPFAEAALSNGPSMAEDTVASKRQPSQGRTASRRSKGLSLFERMTGGFREPEATANDSDEDDDKDPGPLAKDGNDRFGSLSSDDRPVTSSEDDDHMEIPAFLRRQAN